MNDVTLSLRPMESGDEAMILDILTSETVGKTYMLPEYPCREDAIPLFRRLVDLSRSDARYVRCIDLNGTGIGYLNDTGIDCGAIELGYVVHPNHHGNGYMTEALSLALKELSDLGFTTAICGAFEENKASIRVMEKNNMVKQTDTEEISYRGRTRTCVYYRLALKYPGGDGKC